MDKRAIIVDDEYVCRYALSSFLKKKGYDVISHDSAACCELHKGSAFTCSRREPCGHFFLTDNRMPGINGLGLLARQKNGSCKIPMTRKAVLTGCLTPDEIALAEKLGCTVFHKPYDLDQLSGWLDQRNSAVVLPDLKAESIVLIQGFSVNGYPGQPLKK